MSLQLPMQTISVYNYVCLFVSSPMFAVEIIHKIIITAHSERISYFYTVQSEIKTRSNTPIVLTSGTFLLDFLLGCDTSTISSSHSDTCD